MNGSYTLWDFGKRRAEVREYARQPAEDGQNLERLKGGVAVEVAHSSNKRERTKSMVNVAVQVAKLREENDRLATEQAALGVVLVSYGIGTYRDKKHPAVVADTFQSLVSRSKALPVYLPGLDRYLLDYPDGKSENIESQFYWEKVNFGLKPTLRIVQAILYRGTSSSDPAYAIAVKQLYASHYFETALDLTVCVRDQEHPEHPGIYLVTLKGSQQAGLTGLKGGIVRKVAVDKTRASLERALGAIKARLESQTN